jgi:hypothetical protein
MSRLLFKYTLPHGQRVESLAGAWWLVAPLHLLAHAG